MIEKENSLERTKLIADSLNESIKPKFPDSKIVDYLSWGVTRWKDFGFRHEGYALINENNLEMVVTHRGKTVVSRKGILSRIYGSVFSSERYSMASGVVKEKDYWDKVLAICTLQPYQGSGFVGVLFDGAERDKDRIIIPSGEKYLIECVKNLRIAKNPEVFNKLPNVNPLTNRFE